MAESATRTESVRMYVMRPTGPSAPTSIPSYSCWASRIVTAAEKPSCLAASCCNVLVRNGGGAARRRSPVSTAVTLKGILSASATIARAVASSLISGFLPSSLCSRAWNPWPSFSRSASMVQYRSERNLERVRHDRARGRLVFDLGLLAVQLVQPGLEPLAVLLQVGLDGPVLLRHELADLLLALADQPQRDGLHPPR